MLSTDTERQNRRRALSCFYFFFLSGAFYALLTSRMPALKAHAGVSEGELGIALLSLGAAAVCCLLLTGRLIRRFSSAALLRTSALLMCAALPIAALAPGSASLCASFALFGMSLALHEACMNTQGLLLEISSKQRFLGKLQGGYSVGCIAGAAFGSVFAYFSISPLVCFLAFSAMAAALWLPASRHMLEDMPRKESGRRGRLPAFVYFCGFMEVCAFEGEGTIGDWGSLFLHSLKGADEGFAALAFAVCAAAMAAVRFATDHLRGRFGDFPVLFSGALLSASGFFLAILSPSAGVSLFGFGLAGAGVAPAIPILMSRAGSVPGVDPGEACSTVSVIGYSALLIIPPAIGIVSEHFGLATGFLIPAAGLLVLAACSPAFRNRGKTF